MSLAAIKTAAEESLAHTWSGGEIPIGPSIPGAYQNAVRAEKANARNVLWLAERVEELAEALSQIGNPDWWRVDVDMGGEYETTDWRDPREAISLARAALARLEGEQR